MFDKAAIQKYIKIAVILAFLPLWHIGKTNASPPIPPKKTQSLQNFQKQIDTETGKVAHIKEKASALHEKISAIKKQMTNIAQKIQSNEKNIKKIEQRMIKMEIKKSVLEDKLNEDRKNISRLILALQRIRRMPPEALLAKPDTPYRIAQSALLMEDILPAINRHAEILSQNLQTLNEVTADLEEDKKHAQQASETLDSEYQDLLGLMSEHKLLYATANKDIKISEIKIKEISLKAKNLEELVEKLKKREAKEQERQRQLLIKKREKQIPALSGNARFPISGIIKTSYNQKDKTGTKSKGITLAGRANGLVVAPMSGKISFTGSFKRYGNIVIIEHANGYHSLLAGIENISAQIGDIVKIGEPIGLLPKSSLIPKPTLYYELRKNGEAINPSVKFPDLG